MKPTLWILSSAVLLIAFAACESEPEIKPDRNSSRNRFGHTGQSADTVFASPTPDPSATPDAAALTDASPTPTPGTTAATTSRDLPYGTPVPGKPGFVTSPHAPYAGYVDVRGFPPGTEVKCPFSSKIFLVP